MYIYIYPDIISFITFYIFNIYIYIMHICIFLNIYILLNILRKIYYQIFKLLFIYTNYDIYICINKEILCNMV